MVPVTMVMGTVVAAVATFGGIPRSATPVSGAEAEKLIAEAEPVLVAVRRYEKRTGHVPGLLNELVPRELPSIPKPRIASGHDYLYGVESNQWRFAIPLPGARNDVLMYSSIGDYQKNRPGAPVERMGLWARYHGAPR